METEDLEIIYIALYNQILLYSNILENESLEEEERGMTEYLLERTKQVEEKYRNQLDPGEQGPHTIGRPKW